jgi:hypothetical protein
MGVGLFRLYTQLIEKLSSRKMRFIGQAIAVPSLPIRSKRQPMRLPQRNAAHANVWIGIGSDSESFIRDQFASFAGNIPSVRSFHRHESRNFEDPGKDNEQDADRTNQLNLAAPRKRGEKAK